LGLRPLFVGLGLERRKETRKEKGEREDGCSLQIAPGENKQDVITNPCDVKPKKRRNLRNVFSGWRGLRDLRPRQCADRLAISCKELEPENPI
jgi:hypothetical protein